MNAIGVLGEDDTDCRTVKVLIRRIVSEQVDVRVRAPSKGGCAALRRSARGFMAELRDKGCGAIVLVHDLDRNPANGQLNDEAGLRAGLESISVPSGVLRLICIPVEELEAWFWADQRVLDLVGKGVGRAVVSPENVRKPKEALRDLSWKAHYKPVYSTNDNWRLAEYLDIELCARKCRSFRELRDFALQVCGSQ
ncbi:DUF4276 family protein [Sorangium sp. So ce296]|uniref:DUF4276 family protein n=1 Tax=Sorangium sp. So ce296 TaxID=3133296 RepID=UPI003F5FF84C